VWVGVNSKIGVSILTSDALKPSVICDKVLRWVAEGDADNEGVAGENFFDFFLARFVGGGGGNESSKMVIPS